MRVLFLGAGASKSAGYPLGAELIDAVSTFMTTHGTDANTRARWSYFNAFKENARGTDALLLTSSDPEVVLTYIDTCIQALQASDAEVRAAEHEAVEGFKGLPADLDPTGYVEEQSNQLQAQYAHLLNSPLRSAVRARQGFVVALRAFLEYQHFHDGDPDAAAKLEYLRRELRFVHDGDVVITTNYDTLIERVLLSEKRWSYGDGYGFDVPIRVGLRDHPDLNFDLPEQLAGPSAVRVLKLHGSYGWQTIEDSFVPEIQKENELSRMFLEQGFFQGMPAFQDGKPVLVYDIRDKATTFPIAAPLLAYPSYLKPLGLQETWENARLALAKASEIRILGASLPPADLAVRTLFNPVRFRLAAGSVTVSIHDKSAETADRWRNHLGNGVRWERRYAGE